MRRRLTETEARERMIGFTPSVPYPGALKPWPGRWNSCGHEGQPRLADFSGGRTRECATCVKDRNAVRMREIALAQVIEPDEALRRIVECGFIPEGRYPGARKNWEGVWASCGHRGAPRYAHVVNDGMRCGRCATARTAAAQRANIEVLVGRLRDVGFEMDDPGAYQSMKIPVRGTWINCGHRATARLGNVLNGAQTRCGHMECFSNRISATLAADVAGRAARAAARRLPENVAREAVRDHGFEPTSPYPGANSPWLGVWVDCGHAAAPSLTHVKERGRCCGQCAENGPRRDQPNWIYLMARPGEQQFGCTVDLRVRTSAHGRYGWVPMDAVGPMDGATAYRLEAAVKRKIREFALPGTTETWSTADLEVMTVAELFAWAGVSLPVAQVA